MLKQEGTSARAVSTDGLDVVEISSQDSCGPQPLDDRGVGRLGRDVSHCQGSL
jgi:hypothetical protein